jgi:DNA polymerase
MRMRGQWREWRLAEGAVSAPALPTLHPAFLLRQPVAKREVWADLLSLAARIDG